VLISNESLINEAQWVVYFQDLLLNVLRQHQNVEVAQDESNGERTDRYADISLEVRTKLGPCILVVDVKTRAWPKEIEGTALRLKKYVEQEFGSRGVGVIASPSISKSAADAIRAAGVSWIDAAGNCQIDTPVFYLSQEGKEAPKQTRKQGVNPFGPQASRVLATLLDNPNRSWTLKELQAESGVSFGLVSLLRRELANLGYFQEFHG
jgi:hypothetical protein